ncbi:hypothetical protein, partial [Desulfovibrio sp.]|uniref:hypothetical protein n=1 Tax=Desulfovibrio sp. TaxID=885 RepID=UPI003AB2D3A3
MNTQPEDRPLADLVADLMQPLMAYAALLEKAGNLSQSKLVWALLEDHYRKLTALLEQVRQQAPDVALETPRWK